MSTSYYNNINEWEKWWRNEVEFHKYHDQSGTEREMYTLGMAKRVSEDWASVLFTERDEITTETKRKVQYTKKRHTRINYITLRNALFK